MGTATDSTSGDVPPAGSPRATPPAQGGRCVIVLDGDAPSRARAEAVLAARGYRVVGTADPASAVTAVRTEIAGLLLADMAMRAIEPIPGWERRRTDRPPAQVPVPDREGYAVLCSLEADPDTARCPVVFVKEQVEAERSRVLRLAVVGFVAKPWSEDMLAEEVRRSLPRRDAGREVGPGVIEPDSAKASGPGFEALPKPLLKALAVDGDTAYRQFIHDLLVPHGFDVHEAADGEEGLAMALKVRPWLILTDVNMPGMDGFEFCRRVRRQSLLRHIPLVFLSGWDDYWERYHGLKLGAADYLSKQTPARELLIRIQLTLKRYADIGTRTNRGTGMEGGLELIGAPGMLQMCHLGRFSGVCTVRSGIQRVQVTLREGEIVSAESNRARDAEAVYELLSWTRGHFEFLPGDPGDQPSIGENFDYLLLEGCRRLDEQRRESHTNGSEVAVGFRRGPRPPETTL